MPELKTRADFIKALPKKFTGIHKLYKLRDCTKAELVEGYRTGNLPDRVKYASAKKTQSKTEGTTSSYTTSTSTDGFDPSIFENNPAFAIPPNMANMANMTNMSKKTANKAPSLSQRTYANSDERQTIEIECENNQTREITPEELKNLTGMDINELNEINRKQQEERATRQMQQIVIDEMNRLREMESLCTQAIEASIKLRNSALELKNTARLGEHKEYAEVCENIAYVFGNRLGSARMIHMDLCIRRDIPVPKVSYKPDDATINEVRVLNKLRRRYDYTHDRSIDSKYRKPDDFTSTLPDDSVLNREPVVNNQKARKNKNKNTNHGGVTVEDVTDSMPTAAI
jgi:hypothetical protein